MANKGRTRTPELRIHSVINSVIPTRALLLGAGMGIIDLAVRFLVIEHPDRGIILVDGGYGMDIRAARGMKARLYRAFVGAPKAVVTPQEALNRLGLDPTRIKHVILTHLHADHVCNLHVLPEDAQLHLAMRLHAMLPREGKPATRRSLLSGDFPELVPAGLSERAQSFEDNKLIPFADRKEPSLGGYDILGDGSILALSLPGHAEGHYGLVFPRVRSLKGPLLYGADVAWTYDDLGMKKDIPAAHLVNADRSLSHKSRAYVSTQMAAGRSVLLCHDDRKQKLDFDPAGFLA